MGQSSTKNRSLGLRKIESPPGILDGCVILEEGCPTTVTLYKNGISYVQRHGNWDQGFEEIVKYKKDNYRTMKKKDLKITSATKHGR